MSRFADYIARRGLGKDTPAEPPAGSPLDLPLTVTFFPDRFAMRKEEATISLRAMVRRIADTEAADKAGLPWLKLAAFGTQPKPDGKSLRHDANVLEIHGIEADYDGETITLDRARKVLGDADVAALLYTSPSHTAERPRWRILCPLSRPLPPADRAGMVARLNGLFIGALAGESFTLSQSYYFGRVTGNDAHEVVTVEGRAIDLADELEIGAVGRQQKAEKAPATPATAHTPRAPLHATEGSRLGRETLDRWCFDIRNAAEGQKHAMVRDGAFAVGGMVAAGHLVEGEAWAALREALAGLLPRCKDPKHAEKTLHKSFRDGLGRPQDVEPPEPEPAPDAVHPAAPFLAKLYAKKVKEDAKPLPVPVDIMQPGGVLQMLMDETTRSAIRPQPFLALGAAICAVGALAGRRYRNKTDLRTNFYVAAVAESGGGKDHAPEFVRRCLDDAKLSHYLGGETLASGRGVLSSLEQHPVRLFQVDELGLFLTTVTGQKAAPHKAEIWTELMKLYSRAKGIYRGTEYADKKAAARVDINQPCACFYGTTTPSTFWGALEGGAMKDGSLARFLVFVTDNDRPGRNKGAGIIRPSPDLLAALQAVSRGQGEPMKAGNLPAIHVAPMTATDDPPLYTVPATDEADTLHERNLEDIEDAWAKKVAGTPQAAIVNRLGENAAKLALVCAISRNPHQPEISPDDVRWAWALAEHCVRTLLRDADQFIADNDYEREVKRLISIIAKNGPITEAMIVNRHAFRRIKPRERTDMLRDLVLTGAVILLDPDLTRPGPKNPRYAIAPGVAEILPSSEDDEISH